MSKVSTAKKQQHYTEDAPCCMRCVHFKSEMVEIKRDWTKETWKQEKNKRCGYGNFAVKKTAWCAGFIRRPG